MQPVSTAYVANGSPRVSPRLAITTGTPSEAARRTKRSPLITVRLEPTTSSAPSRSARESTAA